MGKLATVVVLTTKSPSSISGGCSQKAFYMIIAIVLLGTKPFYTRINAQTTRIQTVDFTTAGNSVAP